MSWYAWPLPLVKNSPRLSGVGIVILISKRSDKIAVSLMGDHCGKGGGTDNNFRENGL